MQLKLQSSFFFKKKVLFLSSAYRTEIPILTLLKFSIYLTNSGWDDSTQQRDKLTGKVFQRKNLKLSLLNHLTQLFSPHEQQPPHICKKSGHVHSLVFCHSRKIPSQFKLILRWLPGSCPGQAFLSPRLRCP